MASPQLEDGYTKIANEILEALARIRIPGEAQQVLNVIIRQTYGWGKKWSAIRLNEFQKATGLNKPATCRAISKLLNMRIIIKKDNGEGIIKKDNGESSSYGLQKNFELWQPLSKKITIIKKDNDAVIKKDNPLYTDKEKRKKDILPKTSKKIKPGKNLKEEIQVAMSQFNGDHVLIENFLTVVASENKTGLITESRKLSLLCQLGDVLTTTGDREIFRKSILEVTEREVGNINYLKKVIQSRQKQISTNKTAQEEERTLGVWGGPLKVFRRENATN